MNERNVSNEDALTKKCKKLTLMMLILMGAAIVLSVVGTWVPVLGQIAIAPFVIAGVFGGILILNGNSRKMLRTGKRGVSGYALIGIILGLVVIPFVTVFIAQKLGKAS